MEATGSHEQRQILKSTTIIGGASILKVLFRIIQSKAVALLVGPTGLALLGMYTSTTGLATTLAGVGLTTSGVREIADAATRDESIALAKTVIVFRRLALLLSALGAFVFFVLRQPIAQLTFGHSDYANEIGLLALVPLLTLIAGAQSTILRGMRHIGAVAISGSLGAAVGTFAGLPLLYFWVEDGIAPYLVVVALSNTFVIWWSARRIKIVPAEVTWRETIALARPFVTLGTVYMLSGLTTVAALYLVRVIIVRQLGLDAAGLFEASSAISNVYVGFILGAMGADFFPHLTSVAHDNSHSTQLINAQVEIGLLLATPGLLAVLVMGPWLLQLLYSAAFVSAVEILRWQVLGTFLRVVTWAPGYLLLAQGRGSWYFWTELGANLIYVGATAFGLGILKWELPSTGMAFILMNVAHLVMVFFSVRNLIGFRWTTRVQFLLTLFCPLVFAAFLISGSTSIGPLLFGAMVILGTALYSLKSLQRILNQPTVMVLPRRLRHLFTRN